MTKRRAALLLASVFGIVAGPAVSDEGGVSFWLLGQYGSLAAVPGEPGWSAAWIYYHTSVDAGADREFQQGGQIRAGLDSDVDLLLFGPSYTFEEALLGGQASLSLIGIFGQNTTSADVTLTGPGGGALSGETTDSLVGFGDLYPTFTLKWNENVNNYMVYLTGGIPVGAYEADRLANIGIGHAAIDGGVGYTYFNPQTGREFSIVGGLTYNFENTHTDYQNGIDGHIDWAASQFLSPQVQIGVAGYAYQQITADSGSGAALGPFKSRVFGIGPQIGFLFPAGNAQGYFNVRGYYEFGAEHRPEGWNLFATFAISPSASPPPE